MIKKKKKLNNFFSKKLYAIKFFLKKLIILD
jgi:hypothetical protein